MNRLKISLLVALLFFAGAAPGADDADASPQVRVAGGVMMEYAGSQRSSAEWATRRPDFSALKPKLKPNPKDK